MTEFPIELQLAIQDVRRSMVDRSPREVGGPSSGDLDNDHRVARLVNAAMRHGFFHETLSVVSPDDIGRVAR